MKRAIIILIVLIVGIGASVFAADKYLYKVTLDKFPAYTRINGVDVSDMTVEEAGAKVSESYSSRNFSFGYKGKFYNVPMESLKYDFDLEPVMSEMSLIEQIISLLHLNYNHKVAMIPKESGEFLSQIAALEFCDNTDKEATVDAYVDLTDFDFNVVEEKIGTEVDPDQVENIAFSNIACGRFASELIDDIIIKQPEVTADSEELAERLKYCKDNLSFKLEYEIDGKTEVISPQTLDEMVVYKEDGPKFKEKIIENYITEIASRCNEYNETYNFTTHSGRKITVQGVTFGMVIDKTGMIEDLEKALKKQKSKKLELKWAQLKYSGGEGIGDSYIETSISEQHVWLYKNGKCIVDCPCVTGAPGHDTVRGVYVVQYVTGPTTLRGNNSDGSTYESPVNCFIPFYGGQGFHGSNGWRSQWGGTIYQTSGSHGCVNCPDAEAKKIADNVGSGYPVVIYY